MTDMIIINNFIIYSPKIEIKDFTNFIHRNCYEIDIKSDLK